MGRELCVTYNKIGNFHEVEVAEKIIRERVSVIKIGAGEGKDNLFYLLQRGRAASKNIHFNSIQFNSIQPAPECRH